MPIQATVLTSKQINDVFKILETPRDKSMFGLGIYAGLRIGEIIRLQQDHVFTADGVRYKLTVNSLKKRRTDWEDIPLHHKLRELLMAYKPTLKDDLWLFPSSESVAGHLSRTRAHLILSNAFNTLNIDGARTHSLRRTCLTTMYRAGIPLRTIQSISRHESLSQLQEYLKVDPEDRVKAIGSIKYKE